MSKLWVIEIKDGREWKPTSYVHTDGRLTKALLKSAKFQFPKDKFRVTQYERKGE